MANFLKLVAVVFLSYIGLKIVIGGIAAIVQLVLNLVIPAAVLVGIIYVIYLMSDRKSMMGGGRGAR